MDESDDQKAKLLLKEAREKRRQRILAASAQRMDKILNMDGR
jgi:hypothetical protein